jgi:hypothetical protein
MIPKERKTSGAISLVAGTAEYNLATDFIRLFGKAHFHNSTSNYDIFEYPGGIQTLQITDLNYATAQGSPNWFYFSPQNSTYKKVGFYSVPQSDATLQYDYEASVLVSSESNDLPFHSSEECYSFSDMAARRFKYMLQDIKAEADITLLLEKDQSYKSARAMLYKLLRVTNPNNSYGAIYA